LPLEFSTKAQRAFNPLLSKSCAQPFAQPVFAYTEPARPTEAKSRGGDGKPTASNGGVMGSMKKWMLGAALATGVVGMSAVPAQAAHIGFYVGVGAPVAYVPPCPGPGYVWTAGYWNNGYWVPGYWNFAGGPAFRDRDWDGDRGFYRRDFDGRRDFYDHRDFDHYRDREDRFRR
jgi:hypothetical protein